MASEYLRKSVADRRTGANLIGIQVDTNNMNNIAPDFKMAFNELEAFAKKADELKIQNERRRLKLDIANSRITFKEKYLNDPSVYSTQEKWDEVTALYEEERKKAKQNIANSKYLSSDEKKLYSQEVDLDYKQAWLEPMSKRNGVVTQERVSEATALLETAINNASMDDLYKTGTIENFISQANEIYTPLINLGIATDGDRNKAIVKGIASIEGTRFERKFENDILYNGAFTDEMKAEEIKKAIGTLNNDGRINSIADSMSKEYGYDDYEKEYLKSSLKAQYQKAEAELNKKLYSISVQNKTQKQLEALNNKQNSKDNEMMKAVEKNDPFAMIKATTGLNLTTTEMTAPQNSAELEKVYGYTMATFGDKNNSVIGRVVSDVGISGINNEISAARNDKTLNVTTEFIAKNIIEPYIAENYRNFGDDIAMRKDLGDRIKGLNPVVILEGKENPKYYSTWDTLKVGKDNPFKMATLNNTVLYLDRGSDKRYKELINMSISGMPGAFNGVKGNDSLNLYLSGLIEQKRETDVKLDEMARADYNKALNYLLKNDDTFEEIKEVLPILYKVKVSPINYQQAKLLPYERQANKQSEVKEDGREENSIYGV